VTIANAAARSPKAALDRLWAMTIDRYTHDIAQSTCVFDLSTTSGDATSKHRLRLEQVQSITYHTQRPRTLAEQWDYVELSAIAADIRVPSEGVIGKLFARPARTDDASYWNVSLEIWSSDSIEVVCRAIVVDDESFVAQTGT
jgi:hypothetical protein